MSRKIACIESPFNGTPSERERNCRYAAWCYLDSAVRGEAPHVGHLLGPQAHAEDVIWRGIGLECDFAYRAHADVTAFYTDLGMSDGMHKAKVHCETMHLERVVRTLTSVDFDAFNRGEWPPGATMRLVPAPGAPSRKRSTPRRLSLLQTLPRSSTCSSSYGTPLSISSTRSRYVTGAIPIPPQRCSAPVRRTHPSPRTAESPRNSRSPLHSRREHESSLGIGRYYFYGPSLVATMRSPEEKNPVTDPKEEAKPPTPPRPLRRWWTP